MKAILRCDSPCRGKHDVLTVVFQEERSLAGGWKVFHLRGGSPPVPKDIKEMAGMPKELDAMICFVIKKGWHEGESVAAG